MKKTNPCSSCGYNWQEPWESFPTCHYPDDEPHEWAPCEAADEEDRIAREEKMYWDNIEDDMEDDMEFIDDMEDDMDDDMDGVRKLIDEIDNVLTNRYVVLNGYEDSLYVEDRETGKHFDIKVVLCDD